MHARHRSPLAGYKSSSMGMEGVASASRVSPEGSMRGRALHPSEYRNYPRGGFGHRRSKQLVVHQPSHGNDIFMEAGRLAAEYLVSKGLLSLNALPGKLPNGSVKSPVGNLQGFKTQDGDEGGTSTLSRLVSAAGDVAPDRRKFLDEHNSAGSRNIMRGRRRNESYRNCSSEFNEELQKSGSWDRARAYNDVLSQDDTSPGDSDEQEVSKDSDGLLINSLPGKVNPDIGSTGESVCDNSKPAFGDSNKEIIPINTGNDLASVGEPESNERPNGIEMLEVKADQVNVANNSDVFEENAVKEEIDIKLFSKGHNHTSKTAGDLLSLCRFENILTRTRSSLATRDLKVFNDFVTDVEDAHEDMPPKETEGHLPRDIPGNVSPGANSSHQNHDVTSFDSDKLKLSAMEEESCLTYGIKLLNETSSSSFPECTLMREGEKIGGLARSESCSSIAMGRDNKRELDVDDDFKGGTKRPRDLASLASTFSDCFLSHSNSMENRQTSQDLRTSCGETVMFQSEEKRLVDISMIPEDDVTLVCDFMEKQLLPGSFKSFDLNLMETSGVNENYDADSVPIFPVIAEGIKQETPADIHLTMSSNCNITSKCAKSSFDGGDVEVIDLENDSEQEEKALNNPVRRSEVAFTGTDSFSNNAHSTNNIPNSRDSFGMISEYLGNDIPNYSSLPADMHSLHNDMGLHSGEGMLGDDDSIYMSLGEIPISFLTAWEQPTQEFGKPF